MAKRKPTPKSVPKKDVKKTIEELQRSIKADEDRLHNSSHELPYRAQVALFESIARKQAQLKLLEQSV